MTLYYTGVGSRTTPPAMMKAISQLAWWLKMMDYTMRSGAAEGADSAFEEGAGPYSHVYTPWPGFGASAHIRLARPTVDAIRMAAAVHPAWGKLSAGARALHARNCHQVLGDDLTTPSKFVVCWTPDGCDSERTRTRGTGGTATAIVLADRHGIPVFNLRNDGAEDRLIEWIRG